MHSNNIIISFISPLLCFHTPLNKFLELGHIVIVDKYSTILIIEPMALEIHDVWKTNTQYILHRVQLELLLLYLIASLGTQIVDVELSSVFCLQETGYLGHWVSEHSLATFRRKTHRDALFSDVSQIQVKTVFLVSSFVLANLLSSRACAGND